MRRTITARVMLLALIASVAVAPSASSADDPVELTYATMSDDVKIALAVTYPRDFDPAKTYPALFAMSGYANSVYALGQDSTYVMVHASMRGTGCSGGQYHLFGERPARDGYEIIEDWIVEQPWSDGRVGITGHSFWGLMGFLVTATNPPHVKASAVSGLIDDFYRGIVFSGGVLNNGFPVAWGTQRYRPDPELAAWEYRGEDELAAGDPTCAANIASRLPQYPVVPRMLAEQWDDDFWRAHALERIAGDITIPIHLRQQYQDEQTGPSGANLFSLIPESTPKRLVMSNGPHDAPTGGADRRAWLDCWILHDSVDCPGDLTDPARRVQVHFDTEEIESEATIQPAYASSDLPLPEAAWRALHLRSGHLLSAAAPDGPEPADVFATAPMGDLRFKDSSAPNAVTYLLPMSEQRTFAGGGSLDLWATIDGIDADVFVEIADRFPDGRLEFLQRGMLRATRRAIDPTRSRTVGSGPLTGELWRPWHPHTPETTLPVVPGEPVRLQVEIPQFAHVFRPGHALVLRVSSPPARDRIGGTYTYASPLPSARVSILHDAAHPSRLVLAELPSQPSAPLDRECGSLLGVSCIDAPADDASAVEEAGCLAITAVQESCSFTATGPHSYAGEAVNELLIEVIRDGEVVHQVRKGGALGSPLGFLPWAGTLPSLAGDRIEAHIVPGCAGPACGTAGTLIVGNPAAG